MSGGDAQTEFVIRFEDVSVKFGDTVALDHVTLHLRPGQTFVVYGEAGSGKTVLLKTAVGLQRPDSGRVFLFGHDITTMSERELFDVRARVGILFQEGGLFDSMTIAENVAYPWYNQRVLSEQLASANGSGQSVEHRVEEALRFVELESTLDKFPSELSGGMRRRVGIARAVVTEPPLLLYDSPTAGLDPITANRIIALLIKERDQRKTATIMVTHRFQDGQLMANFRYNSSSGQIERDPEDDPESATHSTRFIVMKEGRLVFKGPEEELKASTDSYVRKFLRPGGA